MLHVRGPLPLSHELDQMLTEYRKHFQRLGPLWNMLAKLDGPRVESINVCARAAEDILRRLELTVTYLMEKSVQVERAKQDVLELKSALDISRQTVDAKSIHLGEEEKQKEEEQGLRYMEFKRIHRFQDEKAALEKELVPAKRRLAQVMDVIDEKCEKLRNLENFHEVLSEHCEKEMVCLKIQTDQARAERPKWDKPDLDIGKEVREFPLEDEVFESMTESVRDLNKAIQHHKQWYEEEMQTKLFYSTRSKEIKHKLNYYKTVIKRLENAGRSVDVEEDLDGRRLSRRSENILTDGSPGVHAREVESYLSRQYGMRVLADYTMLKRLKDEIGVQGLAYLVEKVRLQGSTTPGDSKGRSGNTPSSHAPAPADWDEKRIEQALMGIALEYRDSDERKRMLQPVHLADNNDMDTAPSGSTDISPTHTSMLSSNVGGIQPAIYAGSQQASTGLMTRQHNNQQFHTTAPSPGGSTPSLSEASHSSNHGSASSLRRRSSLARIRKLFKF